MTSKYITASIEAIIEDEDESREELRRDEESDDEGGQTRSAYGSVMKANTGRERERQRRSHKSGSKHASKEKSKNIGVKRTSGSGRDHDYEGGRHRRRHSHSNRSSSSTSSDEEEPEVDHRAVLAAARARLTSPSMISTFTAQTTATNKSSSSSGSNSTVTQSSVTRRTFVEKKPEVEEAGEMPMSPAVPDPPSVFQFLDSQGSPKPGDDQDEAEEEEEEEESDEEETSQWQPPPRSPYAEAGLLPHYKPEHKSASSSASSSFHGEDNFSEPAADNDHNDTDRSSSPERSVQGDEVDVPGTPLPTDQVAAKVASQLAAATQRQTLHESIQFGTPNMPRGNNRLPHVPSSSLSARSQHMAHRPLPRAEKLPVTGYELLATRLSAFSGSDNDGPRIKPMYRKFEALNHRILLHLQDEISELEEQLHRLDHADTQSRRTDHHGHIIPASRRLAAQAGGELQWHKTDVLGKIGYKLAQYNQALSSFNSTQSLHHPGMDDIENYREYLHTEQPIAEFETHFLDPADDLVSIYSENFASHTSPSYSDVPSSTVSSSEELSHVSSTKPLPSTPVAVTAAASQELQPLLPGLASAIAIAVLVPILTFSVIPGFIGRMTVAMLVSVFMVAALMQSGVVQRNALLGRECLSCAGIYVGVMVVIAGIVV